MDVDRESGTLAAARVLRSKSDDQSASVEVSMGREQELNVHRELRGYLFRSE